MIGEAGLSTHAVRSRRQELLGHILDLLPVWQPCLSGDSSVRTRQAGSLSHQDNMEFCDFLRVRPSATTLEDQAHSQLQAPGVHGSQDAPEVGVGIDPGGIRCKGGIRIFQNHFV